jgi:hypothetical protein
MCFAVLPERKDEQCDATSAAATVIIGVVVWASGHGRSLRASTKGRLLC